MSEAISPTLSQHSPSTVYLKDYQAPAYLIDEIELIFQLEDEFTLVTSHLRVRHNRLSTNKLKELILNGEELILESITLDGQLLEKTQYALTDQFLIIHHVPDNFDLIIKTKIYPQKNTALSGLYRSANTYCTQCEAEGFRRITYFLDRPDVLTRYTTTIIADESRFPYLLSNGNVIEAGKSEGGRHWVKWQDPFKKPCYLFALVAGDFDVVEDRYQTQSEREVMIRIFVEKGYGEQAQHALYAVKEAMRWDEKTYGREYDLDIYMIVAIGDFNMGAMENKGLNIFNTKYVLAKPETATDEDYMHILSVVGHEYFHNWSGNRVTCRDWFQLSLKEGLTIFRDQTFTEDTLSRAVMRIHEVNALREVQFSEDAGPLAHPVRPESYIEINNFYTMTIYNKGAEVLRMLQTILGPTLFRKGMDLYFARHDGQAVTIEDYIKTMEDVSGIDLTQFRLWYSQAGTPVVSVEANYNAQQKTYTLTFHQSCPPTPHQVEKMPLYIPIRIGLLDSAGNEMPLLINDEPSGTEKILHFTKASQKFEFKNVLSAPIPSLLRHFSAPVKLHYPYSAAELGFLFKHDKDAFNRWNAGQEYAIQLMLKLIHDYQQQKPLILSDELTTIFEYILLHETQDLFLVAEMLCLPSEKYLAGQMEMIDVDAIHAVREFVLLEVANKLQSVLLKTYHANHEPEFTYQFSMREVGRRQLKNRCLSYLMLLPQYVEIGTRQFEASLKINMTDTLPPFTALVNIESSLRENVLQQFYDTWQQDALVLDKWFAIQAATKCSSALQQVKTLMHHKAFDLKNPNKVYALIGTFTQHNSVHFHAKNGAGYIFLRETLEQLDRLNPQIAARMVKPLTTWRRYDKERQKLMRQQLELLLQKKISKDLYELVTKSLIEE